MINKDNFKALLIHLGFEEKGNIFTKSFDSGCYLGADFKKEELQYPESDGLKVNERQTCNFSSAENAVVFECVHKLLEKGYKPKHIELEPKWKLGHGASGGRADILVKDQNEKPLLIIECKTYGKEFDKAWKETLDNGGQLFSYAQQIAETEFLCLYASEYDAKQSQLLVEQRIISHKDNEKIIELGEGLKAYSKASNVKNRYEVWKETYQLEYTETGIFEANIQPYQIGKSHYTLDIDTRAVTENAVVFECVHKLLEKGYKPKHIELEPKWKLGHGASGGRADILVKDQNEKPLLIIECKTYGKEFDKAWKETLDNGGQLFSYAQQIAETEFLCLYASEYDAKQSQLLVEQRIISHKDNEKIIELGEGLKAYSKASNVKNRYEVWKETYQLEYTETGIFEANIQPYQIGKSHYTLDIDTRAVTEKDKEGKYHRFRTILRQHNIARRETAFEVLVNLFLAKIVDEEENKNNLEFYWKGVAYDNYYDFIDRLQRLYHITPT